MTFTTRQPLWIFADWDETITSKDTLYLIAPPDDNKPNSSPPFSFFSEYYMSIVADFDTWFGPRDTLARQLEYLDELGPAEKESIRKIEELGLFKNIRIEDIKERSKDVIFRPGWEEFIGLVRKKEDDVRFIAVLSVNWSGVFIRTALERSLGSEFVETFEIRANEIEMDAEGKGTGVISKAFNTGICSGTDKLREMKIVLDKHAGSDDAVTVYIGDSNADLPCLLHADIGIIIGNGKSIIETCTRVGIKIESGAKLGRILKKRDGDESMLYHFEDWNAIIRSGLLDEEKERLKIPFH